MPRQSKQSFLLSKLAILLGFSILSSAQVSAQISNIAVNYTGAIIGISCAMENGGNAVTVPFGDINMRDALAAQKDIEIPSTKKENPVKLVNCPPRVNVTFTGPGATSFNHRLQIPEISGGVRGFAIAPSINGIFVTPGSSRELTAAADGSIEFTIGGALVRIVDTANELVAGQIAASMTLTFSIP